MKLQILEGDYVVARLAADTTVPGWASSSLFCSVTRTETELSIVCPQTQLPEDLGIEQNIAVERNWALIRVAGKLDFQLIGILAELTTTLARSDVSVFAVSTFDTDYLLVKQESLRRAQEALERDGHVFV